MLYDEPLNLNTLRSDLIFYAVPYDKLVAPVCPEAKLRKLVKNMIYVGVVAKLLEIDIARSREGHPEAVCQEGKGRRAQSRGGEGGYDYAAANLVKRDPYFIRAHGQDRGQDHHRRQRRRRTGLYVCGGNGSRLVSDHAFVVAARKHDRLHEALRIGADGKATFAIVQAEDELAAIGMVLGAGWAGARA